MAVTDAPLRLAWSLARRLPARGDGPVWIVGGLLRDWLLGRPTADLDLACAGSPRALAGRTARALGGRLVVLDPVHKVYRVVLRRGPIAHVDIGGLQGPGIEEDLARRDFTVDAMALEVRAGALPPDPARRLIDPFGGRRDLARRRLRLVSKDALREDGLRLLRAFRLAAELGLKIDPSTLRRLRADRRAIRGVAGERIQHELVRLLHTPGSTAHFREMDRCGLLTEVFPDLEPLRRCALVYYGPGGVLKHSLAVLERLEELLAGLERIYPAQAKELAEHLRARSTPAASYAAVLKLAALLHDVAKAPTAKRVDGRLRFFGHEEMGAVMATRELRRLRFPRELERAAATLIRHHLRPGNLAANPTVSDRAMFKFFRELGGEAVGLLLLCWADYASYLTDRQLFGVLEALRRDPAAPSSRLPAAVRKTHRHLQVAGQLLNAFFRRHGEVVSPPRLVDGNDVMKALRLRPGPEVGKALLQVREAQAAGRLSTRAEALAWLRSLRSA